LLNQSQKKSKLALTRAKLRSMHSELSYGLSFAPKLQRVATIDLSGSHQPTPDPSFSLQYEYIYCVVHMTYIPYLGTFFSHGTPVWPWPVIYKSNGGRTTDTRHAGKQEDTTPKRGGSLLNYLDQTQTMARKLG